MLISNADAVKVRFVSSGDKRWKRPVDIMSAGLPFLRISIALRKYESTCPGTFIRPFPYKHFLSLDDLPKASVKVPIICFAPVSSIVNVNVSASTLPV